MVQTCTKCSRSNPAEAVYCYFDGFVLAGHARAGGPVAVGAQAFAHPFVFPDGRQCRNFDELALACQEGWPAARDLLKQGYLENFFGGLGRVDLALAAKEAARFPDPDQGLDQLLEKLPTEVLAEPRLSVETQEINLGVLQVGAEREFQLRMENQGMRLVHGTITSADAAWLALGDAAGNQKHFAFQHELALPIRVRPEKLRANTKPLEAHLEIESNAGSFIVGVRAQVPVKPFPSGALAGSKSPRQAAEKAKANAKEAAALFESGAVADWYKSNGWTYPVQGPAASGLGAVQQFFEALGLTPPPKVEINTNRIELSGNPGEQLSYTVEVKTQEKRPVYAHATSDQPWLEVGRARLNGRVATINLAVPSVPNKEGESLRAKLIVQSNGNQRFVVPVTLQVGGAFAFGAPETAPVVEAVAKAPSAPVIALPSAPVSSSGGYRRRKAARGKPAWMHALPALLLFFALLTAVVVDRLMPPPAGTTHGGGDDIPPDGEPSEWRYDVKDPDPRLNVLFDDGPGGWMRFGVLMAKEKDPRNPDQFKKLTYDDHGKGNNTIIRIDGHDYKFGEKTPNNLWGDKGRLKKKPLPSPRRGYTSTMVFTSEKVEVEQLVEIVPGQTGYLDTVLVLYTVRNKEDGKRKVGVRALIDTYIGSNDGVPFTIPGREGFVDTKATLKEKQVPPYLEVTEKPNDPKDHGTVARMGLRVRLPKMDLDPLEEVRICRFPGAFAGWQWDPLPIKSDNPEDGADSCVALYWPYAVMNPGDVRRMGFTYGLGTLEIGEGGGGTSLALSVPDAVQPDEDFVVTAYVWNADKGDKVTLKVPSGLRLADGDGAEKTVEKSGGRSQVFWHLRGGGGTYTLEATTDKAKSKPKRVVIKAQSIFG